MQSKQPVLHCAAIVSGVVIKSFASWPCVQAMFVAVHALAFPLILFERLLLGCVQIWITVVVAVLSVTMSESAIDSLQNAIVDNISGSFLKGLPLIWIRILVLVLSIPVIVVSLQVR